MNRVLAPLNEKRQKPRSRIRERNNLPFQNLAVGALARSRRGPFEPDSRRSELFGERENGAGMSGPANKAGFRERMQIGSQGIFHAGLLRVGRDDFQIAAFSQRKERILRAAPGMNAAKCCAHACVLLDEINAALQIGRAEKNVINKDRSSLSARSIEGPARTPLVSNRKSRRETDWDIFGLQDRCDLQKIRHATS